MSLAPESWDRLRHDPFVTFHIKRSLRNFERDDALDRGGPRIRTARQVIGEQRIAALIIHDEEAELLRENPQRTGSSLAEVILAGVPFLWMYEIDRLASSLPIPRHIIGPDLFTFPTMWWTFEGSLELIDAETKEITGHADALILRAHPNGWYSVSVIGTKGRRFSVNRSDWGLLFHKQFRAGARWPDDFADADRPLIGRLLAMISFLNSPFIDTSRRHPEMGKKPPRGAPRPSPEGVHFVTLRPTIHATSTDHAEHTVEWTVRWIVRGHHRAQWYPSSRSHRLIWIAPYMKGPDGAPLKTPAYAVVR